MKELVMTQALEDAVYNAMIAVESGKFSKVIKLLEYIKMRKKSYDKVMVNYALLISYMNIGDLKNAQTTLKEFDNIVVENAQIKKVIEQIRNEIKDNKKSSKDNLKEIKLDDKKILLFHKNDPDERIWSYYLKGKNGDKESYAVFYSEYQEAIEMLDFFRNKFTKIKKDNVDFSQMYLFNYLQDTELNPLFWLLLSENDFKEVFKSNERSSFVKKYFLERYIYYFNYKMYDNNVFTIEDREFVINELKEFNFKIEEIVAQVYEVFSQTDDQFNEEFYETVCSILKIMRIQVVFDQESYDMKMLTAICCYVINELFLRNNMSSHIEAKTGIKFKKVESFIIKIENILTFLLSE